MTWFKWAGAALAAVAIFVSGYKYAASIYKAEIAQLREGHALATKELTDEYRAKEQSQAQQLADAWDQLERARAESVIIAPDCPQLAPLPAHLTESDSPAAQNFSKKVQNYLLKVQSLLKE